MKKHILTIALMSTLGSFAQQVQNTNWYFGEQAGFHFNGAGLDPSIITTSLNTLDACGSYTDQLGQFRFYTNGVSIFRANNTPIPNSNLMGDPSNTQGVAIVPRPGNANRVYVVTIDGVSGQHQGLHYTEIDLGGNTPGNETVVSNFHNVPLNDGNTPPVVGNNSEKLTTAPHCDGNDYWIITHIGNNLCSYRVSSAGISANPVITPALLDTQAPGGGHGPGQIKISPDNKRVAICYNYVTNTLAGGLALGKFDSNDGTFEISNPMVSIPPTVDNEGNITPIGIYGVEFSPDSQNVYFSAAENIYVGNAISATSANINQVTASSVGTGPDSLIPITFRLCLQRGMNGHIYIANTDNDGNSTVSVIRNPNSPSTAAMQDYAFDFPNNNPKFGFPGWVYWQMGNCTPSYELTTPDLNFEPYTYRVANFIRTSGNYTVTGNQEIDMRAGNFIEMLPNTTINTGSIFTAEIAPCVPTECSSVSSTQRINTSSQDKVINDLQLYPNPSSDYVNLNIANETITHITVTSLEGKTMFKTTNATSDFTLDVTGYSKGMYIVTIATQEGNNFTKKLLVK